MERKYINLRIVLVMAVFCAMFCTIGFRVVQLQVLRSDWLADKASRQYNRVVTNQEKRGTIFDCNMNILASSVSVTSVAVRPRQIPEEKKGETAAFLANALELEPMTVLQKISQDTGFVWLKRKVGPQQAQMVKDLKLKGVEMVTEFDRFYPNKSIAAQTVGFTSIDGKGIEGIEFYCDAFLTPDPDSVPVIRDAHGNILRAITADDDELNAAIVGHNVVLTLDKNIQFIAEEVLVEVVEQFKAKSATAIVMNPHTGAILAMAQAPLFNPNNLQDADRPYWRNRNIADQIEAGSVMKIFSVAAALETGKVKPTTQYYCENGAYVISGHTVCDTKKLGTASVQEIIKVSSNIGVIKVAETIGRDDLYAGLKNFGFGEKTGIECPGEATGRLTAPNNWYKTDVASISFGHGMAVTPIQIVAGVSAIANGGFLMKPYLVKAIVDNDGEVVKEFRPVVKQRAISPETAAMMNLMLQTVTEKGGTGVAAAINGYKVAGKTGTARKPGPGGYDNERHISSFVGFAPADNPAIVVLVIVDEPQNRYYASAVAAPAFNKITQKTLYYLHIAPKYDGDMQMAKQGDK